LMLSIKEKIELEKMYKEMRASGIDHHFVHRISRHVEDFSGLRNLVCLWSQESPSERALTLRSIIETLHDVEG
jgi:hypothetical protein